MNATTQTQAQCEFCNKAMDTTECYWKRFCSDKCRNSYNAEAGRLGRQILKERREQDRKTAQVKR